MTAGWNLSVIAALCAATFASVARAEAPADSVVEQEFSTHYGLSYVLDYPGDFLAQTFTVRTSGYLFGVGVQVHLGGYSHYLPPVDDLHLKLVRTNAAGTPVIAQVLAAATIDWESLQDLREEFTDVDLSAAKLQVQAGEKLAIALMSDQTYYSSTEDRLDYGWNMASSNQHPGGEFYIYSPRLFGPEPYQVQWNLSQLDKTYDVGFRVWVSVPESSGATLALVAMAAGWRATRRGVQAPRQVWGVPSGRHRNVRDAFGRPRG